MLDSALVNVSQKPVFDVQSAIKASSLDKSSAEEKARKVAEDFEASFLTTYINQMFSGLSTEGMFGGGYGEKVYRDMMNEQYAKATAANGGIGVADQVYREILSMQEANSQ